MIKLPKKVVIYPQKRSKPDYLLCWIPANSFEQVATNQEVREELESDYPSGLEIEFSEEGLAEFGIQFDSSPEELRQAYLDLNAQDVLPESGMIEIDALERFIVEMRGGRSIEEITQPAPPDALSFGVTESDPLQYLKEGPEMVGDEDPQNMFQRFSVRQVKPQIDQNGGE
jgi:hypothetical protein